MILDVLKQLIPNSYLPWILLILTLVWVGWTTNDIAMIIEKHYKESTQLIKITEQTCKAVSKTAGMDQTLCDWGKR